MFNVRHLSIIALALFVFTSAAEARGRGKCDGFHRCRCGTTAARHFGKPYNYNGWNLKQARVWKNFPRTSFRVGVAGVVEHHVLAIVGGDTCSRATVYDDAGTYTRNVCHMTFVDPNGNAARRASSAQASTPTIY